jgi:hypothetical protein
MDKFESFIIKRPLSFYTIRYEDLQRPDLLSLKLYGKMDYFWILGKYNGIDDFWNDLKEGDLIAVPSEMDIQDWILSTKFSK